MIVQAEDIPLQGRAAQQPAQFGVGQPAQVAGLGRGGRRPDDGRRAQRVKDGDVVGDARVATPDWRPTTSMILDGAASRLAAAHLLRLVEMILRHRLR